MNAVSWRDVGKRWDGARAASGGWVFRHVDLDVPGGCTTAIVGPSGCGKTTLMQLANAVLKPTEGEVRVFGEPVPTGRCEAFRRGFGYAVQGAGLFPHLTVAQNVSLPARLEGWAAQRIAARRRELFAAANLGAELESRYPHQLSGGQQQRVGLCRALMLRPRILLLDEPFAGIDPITREDLYAQFEQLRDRESATTLLVTHDVGEALRLADHLVVMRAGGIAQAGPAREVAAAPRDDFVRSLLGTGRMRP